MFKALSLQFFEDRILMSDFSITEKENQDKVKQIFENNSNNGSTLQAKEVTKFVTEIGLNNQFFLQDLHYYFPQLQEGRGITYRQVLQFIDYALTQPTHNLNNIETFKVLDRNGTGQISSAQLLGHLKKHLPPKQYQLYVQLLSTSYGPLLNYIDFFKKDKTIK